MDFLGASMNILLIRNSLRMYTLLIKSVPFIHLSTSSKLKSFAPPLNTSINDINIYYVKIEGYPLVCSKKSASIIQLILAAYPLLCIRLSPEKVLASESLNIHILLSQKNKKKKQLKLIISCTNSFTCIIYIHSFYSAKPPPSLIINHNKMSKISPI